VQSPATLANHTLSGAVRSKSGGQSGSSSAQVRKGSESGQGQVRNGSGKSQEKSVAMPLQIVESVPKHIPVNISEKVKSGVTTLESKPSVLRATKFKLGHVNIQHMVRYIQTSPRPAPTLEACTLRNSFPTGWVSSRRRIHHHEVRVHHPPWMRTPPPMMGRTPPVMRMI